MFDKAYKGDDPTNEFQDELIELLHNVKIKLIKY